MSNNKTSYFSCYRVVSLYYFTERTAVCLWMKSHICCFSFSSYLCVTPLDCILSSGKLKSPKLKNRVFYIRLIVRRIQLIHILILSVMHLHYKIFVCLYYIFVVDIWLLSCSFPGISIFEFDHFITFFYAKLETLCL